MNKSLVFILVLLIFCIGCQSGAEFFIDESKLQEGDIAFRGGTSVSSYVVEIADKNGIYSHSGMLVKYEGKWKIVHAVPGEEDETDGIQYLKMDDLDLFFAPDRACAGCFARYDTTPEVLEKVAQEAIRWWNLQCPWIRFHCGYTGCSENSFRNFGSGGSVRGSPDNRRYGYPVHHKRWAPVHALFLFRRCGR